MTSYICKLVHGAYELDLLSAPYKVAVNSFAPPPIKRDVYYAEGTSANRLGGGTVAGYRVGDRSFSFDVHIQSTSSRKIDKAISDLQTWLDFATTDPDVPLYLEFSGTSPVSYRPTLGQGTVRYQIKDGSVDVPTTYSQEPLRKQGLPSVGVNLTIAPVALGVRQPIGKAEGGVNYDIVGVGNNRPVRVYEGNTNLITNPVFGNSTWDTGWTASAGLLATLNTDRDYVLFGSNSAKLRGIDSLPNPTFKTTHTLTLSASYKASYYVKREDGGTIDATVVTMSGASDTYMSIGNGWYLCYCTETGTGASQDIWIACEKGFTVYLAGAQLEQKTFVTPLAFGPALGCTWNGTAHASTTTRTAGKLTFDGEAGFPVPRGTITFSWKAELASSSYTADAMFFEEDVNLSPGPRFYWQQSDGKLYFTDAGSVKFESVAQTWSAGDILTFHITWDANANQAIVYKNGVALANQVGDSYNIATQPAALTLGCSEASDKYTFGLYYDLRTWNQVFTAAEVLADYNAISGILSDGEAVSSIPFFWTDGGDNVLENHDSYIDGANNWGAVLGVPGSLEAITEWRITPSVKTKNGYYLMANDKGYNEWQNPEGVFYRQLSGTAGSGGGTESGDAFERETADTTGVQFGGGSVTNPTIVQGNITYFARSRIATGQDMKIWLGAKIGSAATEITSDPRTITMSTNTWEWFYVGSFGLTYPRTLTIGERDFLPAVYLATLTSTVQADMDYFMCVDGAVLGMKGGGTTFSGELRIIDRDVASVDSDDSLVKVYSTEGTAVNLKPHRINTVWFVLGYDADVLTIADTSTFNEIYITPRYALL